MGTDLKRGFLLAIVAVVLFGGLYPALLWGIGRAVFPGRTAGSLIRNGEGRVVGSGLIAQGFTRPEYFHPRPSAVDYNAASGGGSNDGPSNPEHLFAVRERLNEIVAEDGVPPSRVLSEMVTASGSGLDPDVPPRGAEIQVERVARARGVDPSRMRTLVARHTQGPWLGVFGRARINVLVLNLALDREFGKVEGPDAAGSRPDSTR